MELIAPFKYSRYFSKLSSLKCFIWWRNGNKKRRGIDWNILIKAYFSKFNLKCLNQIIVLMIHDGQKWRYLAVTKFSALLRGVTLKNNVNSFCLNCCHSFRSESKQGSHANVLLKPQILSSCSVWLRNLKPLHY